MKGTSWYEGTEFHKNESGYGAKTLQDRCRWIPKDETTRNATWYRGAAVFQYSVPSRYTVCIFPLSGLRYKSRCSESHWPGNVPLPVHTTFRKNPAWWHHRVHTPPNTPRGILRVPDCRHAITGVNRRNQPEAAVILHGFCNNCGGTICGAVIYQNKFQFVKIQPAGMLRVEEITFSILSIGTTQKFRENA